MPKPVALVLNDSIEDGQELLEAVESTGYFETIAARGKFLASIAVSLKRYRLIIFDCDNLGERELSELLQVSELLETSHTDGQILVLAEQISIAAYRQVSRMKNMITLQKPFSMTIFRSVLGRLSGYGGAEAASFPRFITDEPVRMVVLKTGLLIPTRMKNYSAGGAFLEYRGISLKVGDTIQLNLGNRESMQKAHGYQLRARVIWIQEGDGPRSASRGVGIQFLEQ